MSLEPRGTGAESMSLGSDPRVFFEETLGVTLLHLVADALPEEVTVGFQISGPGGGDWQVSRTNLGPRLGPLQAGPRDCTVRCSSAVFMGMVDGSIDPRDAFLDGRLRLVGDIGLALRLKGILPSAD